jgi:Family of unknown function (DUF6390)
MDGFELAARFSIVTNRRSFCGPAEAEPALYRAITEGKGQAEVERMLSQFEALYPYLEAIASKHGLRPFDREVVEAYWIGNSRLDAFDREDFGRILDLLVRRGLPGFIARELAATLPDHPIPHHLFHVGFVGVGAVTGHVETTLPNMESCRPAAAEVIAIGKDHLEVRGPVLEVRHGSPALGAIRTRSVTYDPKALRDLALGDTVAVHWGWAAVRLTPEMHHRLNEYTNRALAAIRSARPAAAE